MAANSYYIYIKSESAKDNPTKPKEEPGAEETKPKPDGGEEPQKPFNPFDIPKIVKKNKVFIKAFAAITIAKKVLSATEKVSAYIGRETGDYVFNRDINNMLATLRVVTNPFDTFKNIIQSEQNVRLTNQRLAEQRVLTGDTMLQIGARKV